MPPKGKKASGVATFMTGRAKVKAAGTVKSKVGSTRSTTVAKSATQKSHDSSAKKKNRPPVSKSRPGYTLYSTDSDDLAGEVDKGLNKCATIVKQMLDVRKGKVIKKDRQGKPPVSTKSNELPTLPREATPGTPADHARQDEEATHSLRQLNRFPLVIPTGSVDATHSPLKRQQLPPGDLGFQELPLMKERPALFNNRLATSTPDPEKFEEDTFVGKTASASFNGMSGVEATSINPSIKLRLRHENTTSDRRQHVFSALPQLTQSTGFLPQQELENATILRAIPRDSDMTLPYQSRPINVATANQSRIPMSNIPDFACQSHRLPSSDVTFISPHGQVSGVRPMNFLSNLLTSEDGNVQSGPLNIRLPHSDIHPGLVNMDETAYEQLPNLAAVFSTYQTGSSLHQNSMELGIRKSEGFIPVVCDDGRSQNVQISPREILIEVQTTPSVTSGLVTHLTNQIQADGTIARMTSEPGPQSSHQSSDWFSQTSNDGYSAHQMTSTSQPINRQKTFNQQIAFHNSRTFHENNNPLIQVRPATNSVMTQVSPRDSSSPFSSKANLPLSLSQNNFFANEPVGENTSTKLSPRHKHDGQHSRFHTGQTPDYQTGVSSPGIFQSAFGKFGEDFQPTLPIPLQQWDDKEGKVVTGGCALCANRNHPTLTNLKDELTKLKSLKILVNQLRNTSTSQGNTELVSLSKEIEGLVDSLPQDGSMLNLHTEIDLALQPLLSENNQLRRRLRIVTQQLKDMESKRDVTSTQPPPGSDAEQESRRQSENRVKTLEEALDCEKVKSSGIQAELRQYQCDLEQYKADRQKLLLALREKDSDKLKLRQDNLQEVTRLRREVELTEQETEGYKLKQAAGEKENHILAITLQQRDAEIYRLQEVVHTLKDSMSEMINEQSNCHVNSSQLTNSSFNLQKLERLLKEGNFDSLNFGQPRPPKVVETILPKVTEKQLDNDIHLTKDAFTFEIQGRQLNTDFPELTVDALAKHNERSLFNVGTRLGPDGHVSKEEDKLNDDDNSDDSDHTLEGHQGDDYGMTVKSYAISSESSSEPTTKDERSTVETVKEKIDPNFMEERVTELEYRVKRVHFDDGSASGTNGSTEKRTEDEESCKSSVVCDEPSRYSVTDYFKKYPKMGSSNQVEHIPIKNNNKPPTSSTPIKPINRVQPESAYNGDNPSKPSNSTENPSKPLLEAGNISGNSTEPEKINSILPWKRPPMVPCQMPLRTLDDDNTSTLSALTLSSISTLATVDESAFRDGLANLDANIARLQQSLLQKKALLG